MLGRAPKTVLSTIAGLDDGRAWAMRVAMASNCREALDSLIGLDHPTAWELRDACLELWPACVIKSLGVLVSGARGKELLHRALSLFPRNISLLKQAAGVATGCNLNPTVMAA
jgi:dTMP kinase